MFARYGFRIITTATALIGAVLFAVALVQARGSAFLPIAEAIRRCL